MVTDSNIFFSFYIIPIPVNFFYLVNSENPMEFIKRPSREDTFEDLLKENEEFSKRNELPAAVVKRTEPPKIISSKVLLLDLICC